MYRRAILFEDGRAGGAGAVGEGVKVKVTFDGEEMAPAGDLVLPRRPHRPSWGPVGGAPPPTSPPEDPWSLLVHKSS